MGKAFKTAAAFRTSLEERLKQLAAKSSAPIGSLRLKVVIERLLARLFAASNPPWLLKGGYAMELRYRPRARTTKDIDLSVGTVSAELATRLPEVRDQMQAAADQDLGDFFQFQIGAPGSELQGAPDGGARFPVHALLAGRTFARFHIDVGFGDPLLSAPEELTGQDFLEFAGLPPAKAWAIPKAQQFAEKLHAYTFPWADRANTRTKDLVDLLLFAVVDPLDREEVLPALEATFRARNTHSLPSVLPSPPVEWEAAFAEMAREAELSTTDLNEGYRIVAAFWQSVIQGN